MRASDDIFRGHSTRRLAASRAFVERTDNNLRFMNTLVLFRQWQLYIADKRCLHSRMYVCQLKNGERWKGKFLAMCVWKNVSARQCKVSKAVQKLMATLARSYCRQSMLQWRRLNCLRAMQAISLRSLFIRLHRRVHIRRAWKE